MPKGAELPIEAFLARFSHGVATRDWGGAVRTAGRGWLTPP
jgi:hypothetical protein